jgi:hypothetical protein
MTIKCMACGQAEFQVLQSDVEQICVISFCCPACGKFTGVSERVGGGVVVALDVHQMKHANENPRLEPPILAVVNQSI